MISSIFLCILIIQALSVQSKMPDSLKSILQGSNNAQSHWPSNMPENHPIRQELVRDPGILIGRAEDLDLAELRRGRVRFLNKDRMKSKFRNPADIFSRKQRSEDKPQCNIEMQMFISYPGQCIRLADNTPACHNDEYIAINYNECDKE